MFGETRMNTSLKYLYAFFYLFNPFLLNAEKELDQPATFIVSYRAEGHDCEFLNHVRFWLIDDDFNATIYPRASCYVDNTKANKRTVVVKNLKPGNYSLLFAYPNQNGTFERLQEKIISLKAQQSLKSNIVIRLNHRLDPLLTYKPFSNSTVASIEQFFQNLKFPITQRNRIALNALISKNHFHKLTNYFTENPISNSEPILKTQENYGSLRLSTRLKNPIKNFSICLKPQTGLKTPLYFQLANVEKTDWISPPIPTGLYHITYQADQVLSQDVIEVVKDSQTFLNPNLSYNNSVIVYSNNDNSLFHLMNKNNLMSFTKDGNQALFNHLPDGNYLLSFASKNTGDKLLVPQAIHLFLKDGQQKEIRADYQNHPYSSSDKGLVQIITNHPFASFKIFQQGKLLGDYSSPTEWIALPISEKSYTLQFTALKGFETPDAKELAIKDVKKQEVVVLHKTLPEMITVTAGEVILGDVFKEGKNDEMPSRIVSLNSFQISKYPITNEQFAVWLNQALREKKIIYHQEGENKGSIFDLNNNLIAVTTSGNPLSQIAFNKAFFTVINHKNDFPVIFVSWFGASLFAQDLGYRLPTEAEWEMAAGMDTHALKKYRYGFSRNTITPAWANYKVEANLIEGEQVKTTSVGYYNGVHILTNGEKTENAISPHGIYDMSGNVYEWVQDWYAPYNDQMVTYFNPQGPSIGDQKILKGGCYDSLSSELRVSDRLPMIASHVDQFTGFRIAK